MTREGLIENVKAAIWEAYRASEAMDSDLLDLGYAELIGLPENPSVVFVKNLLAAEATAALAAIEAAGVRLMPVETINTALNLIREVEDDEDISAICYYARTLKAMLAASPYAPKKDETK